MFAEEPAQRQEIPLWVEGFGPRGLGFRVWGARDLRFRALRVVRV